MFLCLFSWTFLSRWFLASSFFLLSLMWNCTCIYYRSCLYFLAHRLYLYFLFFCHWIIKTKLRPLCFQCVDSLDVTILALGSRPMQGLAKVQAKSEAWESHFMLLGVWESVQEWTTGLPNEFPLWELDFPSTSKFLKGDCKGEKSFDWGVPYTIGKLLEHKCLKLAHMSHLDT